MTLLHDHELSWQRIIFDTISVIWTDEGLYHADPRHHVGDEGRNKGEPHRRVGCYCSPLAWLGHNFGFKKANRHHQEGDSCTSVQTCTNRFKEKNNWFCIAKALLSNNHISMYGANNHISMYDF